MAVTPEQVRERELESRELKERVVEVNRVAKVVKGGRRFSFTALVVIGDEVELAGIRDILAKSLGTTNPINMLKATERALKQLKRPDEVAQTRGKAVHEILFPRARKDEAPEAAAVAEE